jgi:hypothetical protein
MSNVIKSKGNDFATWVDLYFSGFRHRHGKTPMAFVVSKGRESLLSAVYLFMLGSALLVGLSIFLFVSNLLAVQGVLPELIARGWFLDSWLSFVLSHCIVFGIFGLLLLFVGSVMGHILENIKAGEEIK